MYNRPLQVTIYKDGTIKIARESLHKNPFTYYSVYDITNRPYIRKMIEDMTYRYNEYWTSIQQLGDYPGNEDSSMAHVMFIHSKKVRFENE